MFAWRLFTSFKLVFYLKVWIIVPIYYAETLQLLDAGSRSSFILTNFATLKYYHKYKQQTLVFIRIIFSERNIFLCRYLAFRYVDTFIVNSNSKRRPQWNIQSCQQRDMENGYLETDTIEHFDVRQLSAKWSLIMHFTEYRCWSPHYLLLTCRRLIFRPSISQDKSNQNIFIFWFDFQNSCSNCKFLAGGTWQRRAGAGDCKWCMESAGRSWNRVTDNILGFLGLSSLECAHFCSCFPPSLFRQQSVSGCRVFVQAETRYIYTMCSACAWCHCR